MSDINITIKNMPQIVNAFNQAPKLMVANLNKAITKTVFTVLGKESVQYNSLGIRVISGGLINSIRRGHYVSSLYGEVGPNVQGSEGVDYASYVHDGTRYMRGRPFLLNAVNSSQKEVDEYFTDAVDKTLNTIARMT
jgi:HK97 gp10 family phage protein